MEQRVPRQSYFPRPLLTPTEEWNMKERLLITTAMGIMLGAGAFAQSPTDQSKNQQPRAAQNQTKASPTGSNTNTNAGPQPSTNTAAQPSTNTAAQPSNTQSNTAPSSSSNVSVSASLNENQRTRVSESISRLNVAPINNVNFSLSVGTVVPRDVRFQPLPADVVEVMPQYRGYNFLVVRDDIR